MFTTKVITVISAGLLAAACAGNARQWPLDGLILPAEATPAAFPGYIKEQGLGDFSQPGELFPNEKSMSWGKAFNYPLGWDSLILHFERQLREIGYSIYSGDDIPGLDALPEIEQAQYFRGYLTADRRYKVAVVNISYLKSLVYTQGGSAPTLDGADYLLIIDRAR